LRFLPPQRFPEKGQPLTPGIPLLGFGTSSAFLTLARRSSAQHLPALFHAGPALEVSLQGLLPHAELYILSDANTLLWLVRKPPLQGFAPCECPCFSNSRSCKRNGDPPGFHLTREFPLFAGAVTPSSHELHESQAEAELFIALQSITSKKVGLTLASLPPLPRFATFSTTLKFTHEIALDCSSGV